MHYMKAQTVTMQLKNKYPPPKVITVDVDGTLFSRGVANQKLIEWCRTKKDSGFFMILWSARGEKYAIRAAEKAGLDKVFDCIISKPGYIVDDKGWSWIKYTRVVKRLDS